MNTKTMIDELAKESKQVRGKPYTKKQKKFLFDCYNEGVSISVLTSNTDIMKKMFPGRSYDGLYHQWKKIKREGIDGN